MLAVDIGSTFVRTLNQRLLSPGVNGPIVVRVHLAQDLPNLRHGDVLRACQTVDCPALMLPSIFVDPREHVLQFGDRNPDAAAVNNTSC